MGRYIDRQINKYKYRLGDTWVQLERNRQLNIKIGRYIDSQFGRQIINRQLNIYGQTDKRKQIRIDR